jgi:RNA polymerase sigma factor (sigma-70 family)
MASGTVRTASVAPTLATTTAKRRRTMNLPSIAAGSSCQRPSAASITGDFAEAWRFVDKPLRRYLTSLGMAVSDVDDLVQETATRAIEAGMHYDDPIELRRWAFVVARRQVVDLYRARRRTTAMTAAVERDVAQEDQLLRVENRHLLRSVLTAVATLQPRDRSALGAVVPDQSPAERNRANVARHRAR